METAGGVWLGRDHMANRPKRRRTSNAARAAAFHTRPRSDLWSDEEIADELLRRLEDFSPALSIKPGEDDDQVEVEITMSRTPRT